MNQKLMLFQQFVMEGQQKEALSCARELLQELDPDDDDELEELREVLVRGFSGDCDEDFLSLLEQKGFDFTVTWPGQGGMALVYRESSCRKPEIFQHMMDLGMDPYLTGRNGNTIVHEFANIEKNLWNKKFEELNSRLIRSLPEIEGALVPNSYGATPLHLAVLRGNEKILEALLEKGAPPDGTGTIPSNGFSHIICFDQTTPLHLACSLGEEDCVRLLLECGADRMKKDAAGRTPAHYAVQQPNRLYCPFYYESIPSQEAVLERKCNILCLLDTRSGETDQPDENGLTPLLLAMRECGYDRSQFGLVLLELGADPRAHSNRGRTPLMEAVLHYNKETVKALIAQGVNLNTRDNAGNTALHYAISELGDSKMARYLLKKGADYLMTNNNGFSAMDLAADRGMNDALELMLSGGES